MCIDVDKQLLFLFGGWDGEKDLADFWLFNIRDNQWYCISEDTKAEVRQHAHNIILKNNDGEIFIDLPPNHWASEFSRRSLFLIDENLFLTEQIRAPEQLHQHEAFCCLLLTLNRSSPT